MNDIPLGVLFGALVFLIILSGFFSGSETALMTLNRYRLRHLADKGHPGALRAQRLLERPDRLIGLILLGNNFANILASSLATVIALRVYGEAGIAIAAGLLTLVILVFAEVAPKTLAALRPERLAFPATLVYVPLMKIAYPLVWTVNGIANRLLRYLGVSPESDSGHALSREELRTVVAEASAMIPQRHRRMLVRLLDLEEATIEDLMVPRSEMSGIDLEDDIDEIINHILATPYAQLPVYEGNIDNILGFIPLRKALVSLRQADFDHDKARALIEDAYFVPETVSLTRQILNFQRQRRRIALVVNEYGDLQGLITLVDILEEVVGEFSTDPSDSFSDIHPQADGSYLVDGSTTLRELNRAMGWELPTDGPKTLNGLITEYLEDIPEAGTSLRLAGYPVEIVKVKANLVQIARISPELRHEIHAAD